MDDIYPNDGEFFAPVEPYVTPINEVAERKAKSAKSAAKAQKNTIAEVVERLEKRIAYYNTLTSIPENILGNDAEFRQTVQANKQTVANLQLEIQYWRAKHNLAK